MIKFLFLFISLYPIVVKSQTPRADSTKNKTNYFTDEIEEDEIITLPNQLNVDTLPTNPIKIKRNVFSSEKLYRSGKLKVAIFANDMWKLKKAGINSYDEFYLKNVAYGVEVHFLTTADATFSYQQLVDGMLKATRDRDFDAQIINAEYRYVNENKLLFIEMNETAP
ncbi:MAG: hypothetical protein LH615_07280 [Ferruginibacter sp.]|nr:hypothetical protein [Ferruginibacter sp.]